MVFSMSPQQSMWWCMLVPGTIHAAFNTATARAIAYRWRPVVVSVDSDVTFLQQPDSLRRYTRAIIACNSEHTYGVCSMQDEGHLSLYLIQHPPTEPPTVDAILWSTLADNPVARVQDIRSLCAWHTATVGGPSLSPGRSLEVSDRRLFV